MLRLSICLLLVALAAPAHADGDMFAQVNVGASTPIGDDDYDRIVDTSLKVGVRAGRLQARTPTTVWGFEFGGDYSPLATDLPDFDGAGCSMSRFRMLGGGLVGARVGTTGMLIGRASVGVDHTSIDCAVKVFDVAVEASESDLGIALEFGADLLFDVGGVQVGLGLALPFAFHDEDTDTLDVDYTSIDLDVVGIVRTEL